MSEYEDKRFDEALRDKLSGHSSSLSRDLWTEISEKVDSDDASDNARWKRWGWAGVILLLLSSGIALEFNRSISPVQVFFPIEHQIIQSTEENESSPEIIQARTHARTEPQIASTVISKSEKEADEKVQIDEAFEAPTLPESVLPEKAFIKSQIGPKQEESISYSSQIDEVFEDDVEASTSSISQESLETKENLETSVFINDNSSAEKMNDGPVSDEPFLLQGSATDDLAQKSILDEIEINESEPYSHAQAQEEIIADGTLASSPLLGTVSDEDDLFEKSKKWSLELLVGPSVNYRTFNAESSPELQSHKNENDRMLVSTSYAVMLRREITERFGLSTGVFWLNTGERYEYTVNSATHSFTNHYDYLSIPLELHYQLWSKGDFAIDAGAGIQYNMLKEGTSSWVDLASFQPVTHNNKGPESPFSEQAWAINAEIGIRYVLNDRLDILLQERATFFQESLYKEETGLDQRPYSFNTMVGVGVKF